MQSQRPRIVLDGKGQAARSVPPLGRILALLAIAAVGVLLGQRLPPLAPAIRGEDARLARQLETEKEELARALAVAERGEQVMGEANERLRRQIVALESDLADMRSDLAFYQRLLGAGGAGRGLAVHELKLLSTGSPRVYRFRLTLSQNLQRARLVEGRITVSAEGVSGDRMLELDGAALTVRLSGADARFRFKYFQEFDGSLSLPEGFQPERLAVRLDPDGRGDPVIRRFEWAELASDTTLVSAAEGD